MNPQISVIVPIYNVEKYIHKCIDSILSQTFTDFELILVDDGSPDKCGDICEQYAIKDDRIKVVHKENVLEKRPNRCKQLHGGIGDKKPLRIE